LKSVRQWVMCFHHCLISLFIVAYFSVVGLWLWLSAPGQLKLSGPLAAEIQSKLSPLTCWTGWEQSWSFFSPGVNTENIYTLLTITMQNGLIKLVELPRMDKIKFPEKVKWEKYRKLYNDNMSMSSFAFFRPDVARFMSRANNEPNNPPVRTTFYLATSPMSQPPEFQDPINSQNVPLKHRPLQRYFVYRVHPDDL